MNRDDRGLRIICVIWQNARKHESGIKAELSRSCAILHELELSWSRRMFRQHIQELFGMNGWWESWNLARQCGYGPFKVLVLEGSAPDAASVAADRLRRIVECSNAIHVSLTDAENERLSSALLGVGLKRWLEIVRMTAADRLEAIGSGTRRTAYRIEGTDLCLKSYIRSTPKPNVSREVSRFRFNLDRCTCAQEGRYFRELQNRVPSDLLKIFPETLELVALPKHGWSLVEERIVNADGTAPQKFLGDYQIASPHMRERLLSEFLTLMDGLARYAVRFYDPQNILVQWLGKCGESDFRLRIVDFEPTARTFISLDSICPAFVRMKVRRREQRYLKHYQEL